jgi:hypothetical protein
MQTVDRVLDVMLLPPPSKAPKAKSKANGHAKTATSNRRGQRVILSASASTGSPEVGEWSHQATIRDGIEPPFEEQMDIDDWEEATGRVLDGDDVDEVAGLVTWCYVRSDSSNMLSMWWMPLCEGVEN